MDADEAGVLTLEAVLVLPVVALLVVGLLQTAGVLRDVLVLHEAARSAARTAATDPDTGAVTRAAHHAAPELILQVEMVPPSPAPGDTVTVTVRTEVRLGPVTHPLSARAVQVVEPAAGLTSVGTRGPS